MRTVGGLAALLLAALITSCTSRVAGTPVTTRASVEGPATARAASSATVTATATVTSTTTEMQGQRTVLDRHAVETTIEEHGYTGVVCNHGVDPEVEVGGTFTCVADGGKLLDVTITSANGDYAWTPSTRTLPSGSTS
jgi:hypothetical protein